MSSLKEIANRVGVTHTLVSRVLNHRMGTARVSEATRKRIFEVAEELHYQPNQAAKALRHGRQGAIGVFIHGVGAPGTDLNLDFIRAASQKLSESGNHCWLKFFADKDEFAASCEENLLGRIDGLIVAGIAHDVMESLDYLSGAGLPVVFACHGPINEDQCINFQVDAEAQGYLATKHLIEQGCRQIAHFFTLPPRYRGYLRAHTEAGLSVDDRLTVAIQGYTAGSGARAIKIIWNLKTKVHGVCAQSDGQAVGALQYLNSLGTPRERWPLVVGMDNSPIATDLSPVPLSSVTAEMERCAHLAVEAVLSMIDGGQAVGRIVPPQLVVRESTQSPMAIG